MYNMSLYIQYLLINYIYIYIQYLLINYINIFIYKILIDKIYTITLFVNNIKTFIKNIIRICLIKVFNEIINNCNNLFI